MMRINKITQTPVGADLSRPSPIIGPWELKHIGGPLADKSAVRQSIVRLQDITEFGR